MDAEQLSVVHEHYRDTCGGMSEQRDKRDRYFYLVVLVLAVAMFDITAPQGFATVLADVLKSQFGLAAPPDLAYIRSLLWFLLLGLTIRYGQAALGVERLYIYLNELEATLATHVGAGFRREGVAYGAYNPIFLTWAHYLYTLVFPVLLAMIALVWISVQIPGWPWPFGTFSWKFDLWVNVAITATLLGSIGMYLHAFHLYSRRDGRPRGESETTQRGGVGRSGSSRRRRP
jgi:hypothetical protein